MRVYGAFTARGTGDGLSRANAAAWTTMDTLVSYAAMGSAPYEVLLLTDEVYPVSVAVATLTHGGSPGKQVVIRGTGATDDSTKKVICYGIGDAKRSFPYRHVAPARPELYFPIPPGGYGKPGTTMFSLEAGCDYLRFAHFYLYGIGALARLNTGDHTMVEVQDTWGRNVRRYLEQTDATATETVGNHGASEDEPIVFTRNRVRGMSRSLMRSTNWTNFRSDDTYVDFEQQGWDGTPAAYQFAGNFSYTAHKNVLIERLHTKNTFQITYDGFPATWTLTGAGTGGITLTYAGKTTAPIAIPSTAAIIKAAMVKAGLSKDYNIFVTGIHPAIQIALGNQLLLADPGPLTMTRVSTSSGSLTLPLTAAWAPLEAAYFQGDGIINEEYDKAFTIRFCLGENHSDGSMDLKSDNTLVYACKAVGCKRNFRTHPAASDPYGDSAWNNSGVTIVACEGYNPYYPKYPPGMPLAGQFSLGQQAQVETNGLVTVLFSKFVDDGTSQREGARASVFYGDGQTAHLKVQFCDVTRPAGPEVKTEAALVSGLFNVSNESNFSRTMITDTQI